ncbi:MAG: glycosyltransferase family 2 protein [Rhodospirillales bacterium]
MNNTTPVLAVIIPAYRVAAKIADVIAGIPVDIAHIIVVDDACPEGSGDIVEALNDKRLHLVRHTENQGVGGAVISGYRKALELGAGVMVKIDGDGQMDPAILHEIAGPVMTGEADYAKGNRFADFRTLKRMPTVRLLGNSGLSFLLKAASGYWTMLDPTNGYTAIHARALEKLVLDRLDRRYFFESDLLIRLGTVSAVVVDVPMEARYADENSSLNIPKTMIEFPLKILRGLLRRLFLRYFIYDFNMASVYLMFSVPLLLFSLLFGIYQWIDSSQTGIARPLGTIMVVIIPLILGFQMLLQAIAFDVASTPKPRKTE